MVGEGIAPLTDTPEVGVGTERSLPTITGAVGNHCFYPASGRPERRFVLKRRPVRKLWQLERSTRAAYAEGVMLG
jgi:hypothetical protein